MMSLVMKLLALTTAWVVAWSLDWSQLGWLTVTLTSFAVLLWTVAELAWAGRS